MDGSRTDDPQVAIQRLQMVRVAKDLFESEWYADACETLQFSQEACEAFGDVRVETREERDALLDLTREWASRIDSRQTLSERARDVARVARRDFLLHLIDTKTAQGEALERAALLAPLALQERLRELATVDFRHAVLLRELLVAEVQEAWRTRHDRRV